MASTMKTSGQGGTGGHARFALFVTMSMLLCIFCPLSVESFAVTRKTGSKTLLKSSSMTQRSLDASCLRSASIPQPDSEDDSHVLTREQIKPIIALKSKGASKEKLINAFGLWAIFVSLLTCIPWVIAMTVVSSLTKALNSDLKDGKDGFDPDFSLFDYTGKLWSRAWLALTFSFPTVSGSVEELRKGHGPCLYVANHASWIDIPVLCTVLDPVFKFIAKGELAKLPCIGQQLKGGNHIMIDREDRRSQLRTFKEGIGWLKKGVPLMAFPEGARSPDGRLMEFKGGVFSMAIKQKVPIIPLSISHTHAIMGSNALMPVQPGRGILHVHVHPPIATDDGKTDEELAALVRTALLSEIPKCQHPLESVERLEPSADLEVPSSKTVAVKGVAIHHAAAPGSSPAHHVPASTTHSVPVAEVTESSPQEADELTPAP